MKIKDALNENDISFLKNHISNMILDHDLTDDEFEDFYSKVEDLYTLQGFGSNYNLNEIGKMAEPIIDKISKY